MLRTRMDRWWLTLVMAASLAACSGGTEPDGGGDATLLVTPTGASLRHPGDTIRIAATLGGVSTSAQWSSSNPGVATVADGLVSATGYGSAQITASAGTARATLSVTVTGETSLQFLQGAWTTEQITGPAGLDAAGYLVVAPDQGSLRMVWRGTLDGVEVETVSLAAQPSGQGWIVAHADGVRGTFAVTLVTLSPGRILMDSGSRLGSSYRERTVLDAFMEGGFVWTVEESSDGGATWTTARSFHVTPGPPRVTPGVLETLSPSCTAAEHRQFDYWAGNWTVRVPSGGVAGTNRIHRVAGCGIQENWRGASSGGGVSLNMWDPRTTKWAQFYVDASGGIIELYGDKIADSMTLQTVGSSVVDRIVWSPLAGGKVRQLWERSGATGGWTTQFDGTYEPM